MSQENVEIVRHTYAAFERGDLSAALDNADPDLVTYRADPEARTWHGHDGFLQAFADWTEGFDEFRATAKEFIDAGDRVVVIERLVGKGKGSGIEVEQIYAAIWTVRDGRVVRIEIGRTDPREALEALGLSG